MKKAFTLIELLIVIAIIGILAGILFVSIGQRPLQGARDSKRTADLQNLRTGLTLYYTDNNQYPATLASLVPTYMPGQPTDPRSSVASGIAACSAFTPNVPSTVTDFVAGDFGYRYAVASNSQGYVLQTCLEEATNPALNSDCDDTGADPPCSGAANIYDVHS